LIAEAMKLAFADRAYWLGDADFAKVPRGLADKQYAALLAKRIDQTKASEVPSHGLPPDWKTNVYGKHTTHIAAADTEGNWVAITATINTPFGSKVVVPGTGILLNNEMDDFSARPGVPNAFGLVGAEANAIAPGKRPLSSMSPTIVLKDGVPVLTLGGAGGPMIITEVLTAIVRFIDGGQPLDQCVGRPRLHHQWRPARLFVEKSFQTEHVQGLKDRGHDVEFLRYAGVAQAISRSESGGFVGVSDPRVPGKAAGWFSDQ
jgi:gamma-glutamyltranspeptidase/glutathione hydrolase